MCRLVSIGSIGSHFEIRGVGGYPQGAREKTRGWGYLAIVTINFTLSMVY
jgi:hypothetical protein